VLCFRSSIEVFILHRGPLIFVFRSTAEIRRQSYDHVYHLHSSTRICIPPICCKRKTQPLLRYNVKNVSFNESVENKTHVLR